MSQAITYSEARQNLAETMNLSLLPGKNHPLWS